jgi:hypothetical protein
MNSVELIQQVVAALQRGAWDKAGRMQPWVRTFGCE